MSWYKEGSITLEQKSKKVIGSGTKWTNPLIGICAGQMLILKNHNTIEIHEIASVQTDTELTLAKPYNGETKSGLLYEIPTAPKISIETLALRISEMFNYYQQQMEGWQTVLTGDGEVTLTAPDGRVVTIKSQYSIQKELLKLVEQGKNFAESANKSAGTIKYVSETVEGYANHAKVYADNANKSAKESDQSAKSSSDSAKIAKASENNANSAAKNAKTSEDNAKKWASSIDTSTLVKKTGDTMSGQLILSKNGLKINYDNKNIMALITADDNYSHVFYDAEKKQWLSKLVYNSTINSWSFQNINDVVINGKSVLKTGDAIQTFGDLSTTINLNELTGSNEGIYYQARNASAVTERGYPIGEAGTLQVFKNGADGDGCCQIYTTYRNTRQFIRNYRGGTKTWEAWNEIITTANSKSFIKTGDYGIGALTGPKIDNPDETLKGGCYATRTTAFPELTEYQNRDDSASLIVYPAWTKNWYVEKLAVVYSKTPRIYYRCATPNGKQPFYEVITTANASADIVSALPATKSVVNGVPTYSVGDHVVIKDNIGEFRLMPFRANELPFGWYFRNGDNYLLSSRQGKALNGLSDNYKRDHQITIKNINGQQYINVPSAFAHDGRGFFERAVNGTNRQVGDVEGDSMRQLNGSFLGFNETGNNINNMFFSGDRYIFDASGSMQNRSLNMAWIIFDNNRVNNPISNENRPLNVGLTPVIYLGV